jgi:hypothetical protein
MRKLAITAALALVLTLPLLARAQTSAWQEVWQSERATFLTSVVGRVSVKTLGRDREQKATAEVRAAGGKMRLDYQAGPHKWSLLDDGRRLIRLYPATQVAISLRRPEWITDRALAERNYVARVTGEAEVAGRPVRLLEVAAGNRGPVAWRLWLDRETKFPLKRERYNVDGKLTSGTEYLEVKFGLPVPPDTFAIPAGWRTEELDGGDRRLTPAELSRQAGFLVAQPRYLPPGYVFQGGYLRHRARHGSGAAELRYTDGLRVLTVAQHPPPGGGSAQRGGRRGGRGAGAQFRRGRGGPPEGDRFSRWPGREEMTIVDRGSEKAIRHFSGERVVLVVGDVTAEELVKVARSLD